jgi:hypothetical protein
MQLLKSWKAILTLNKIKNPKTYITKIQIKNIRINYRVKIRIHKLNNH